MKCKNDITEHEIFMTTCSVCLFIELFKLIDLFFDISLLLVKSGRWRRLGPHFLRTPPSICEPAPHAARGSRNPRGHARIRSPRNVRDKATINRVHPACMAFVAYCVECDSSTQAVRLRHSY